MVAATPCREVCVGGLDRCVCVGGDGKEFKGNVTRYTYTVLKLNLGNICLTSWACKDAKECMLYM